MADMADGHVIQGSSPAMRRISQSANLAEILSSKASETQVDDNRSTDECVTGFINDLINILQSKSSEAVIRHLVAKHASNLVGLRDKVLQVVQFKWSSCPKGKLMRRITRSGGTTASEKLAQDIVLLVKFYECGEVNQGLMDIFQKVRNTELSYVLDRENDNNVGQPTLKKVLEMLEELEAKFVESSIQHKAEIDKLKDELCSVQSVIAEKNTKIIALETEISSMRANCRTSKDLLNSKCESICDEMEKISAIVKSISTEHKKLKENNVQVNKKKSNQHKDKDCSNPEIVLSDPTGNSKNVKSQSYANALTKNNTQIAPELNVDGNCSNPQIALIGPNGNGKDNVSSQPCTPERNNAQAISDHSNANSNAFIGVERRYIKRIYLGGVKDGVEAHAIKEFMEQKGVHPTFVRMMKSKRKGTVGVRINVIAADLKATLETGFWPKNIYAREWLSKERWEKRLTRFNSPPEEQHS